MAAPGPCCAARGETVLSDGRGHTNQLVNTASDTGWEHFQPEVPALLLWHFLSWLKSELFLAHAHKEKKKKIIAYSKDGVQHEITQ